MADLDGQWRTWTDIGRLGRTLADSDGHWRTQTDSFCKGQACLPRSQNKGESLSLGTDRIGVFAAGPDSAGFCRTGTDGFRVTKKAAGFCRKISFLSTLNLHRAFLAACIRGPILF